VVAAVMAAVEMAAVVATAAATGLVRVAAWAAALMEAGKTRSSARTASR